MNIILIYNNLQTMKTNSLLNGIFVAVLMAICSPSMGSETEVTKTVKVTASRVEQDLMDVPMSVSVMTVEDIKHSSAKSVGELLEDLPGVRINNDGGQGIKRVSIRGDSTFHTTLLIDGQKLTEQKSMSGIPLLISPSDIERIEVVRGPASVLYGSDALGGVINIITKKDADKPFQADVSVGYTSATEGVDGSVSFRGNYEGWHYRLSAGFEQNNELRTPEGRAYNSYFDSRNVGGIISYDITKDWNAGISLDYYKLKFGSGDVNTPYFAVDVPSWERTKVGVFTEARNVNKYLSKLRADAFYQRNDKEMVNTIYMFRASDSNYGRLFPIADNKLDQYGFNLQSDWQLGANNLLIVGYEFNYDRLRADSDLVIDMKMPYMVMSYLSSSTNYKGYQMSNAVFANIENSLPADFTLNYGVRYTWVRSHVNITDNLAGAGIPTDDRSDSKAVFNVGLVWRGLDDLAFRLNYAQGYKFPLLQNLYVDTSMGQTGVTYSNQNLKPETSDNFEFGIRWAREGIKVDAAAFLNLADDYIDALYNAALGADQYQNVAKAKTFGIELDASWKLGKTGIEPYAVFTWMRRQFKQDGFKTYDSGTPELFTRYGVRWSGNVQSFGVRTDVYARSQTASDYKTSDGSSDYHLGGATTFNITGGVDFGPKKQYSLDVGLYNIFDKAWRQETSIYEPGRYFAAKLNASF